MDQEDKLSIIRNYPVQIGFEIWHREQMNKTQPKAETMSKEKVFRLITGENICGIL